MFCCFCMVEVRVKMKKLKVYYQLESHSSKADSERRLDKLAEPQIYRQASCFTKFLRFKKN